MGIIVKKPIVWKSSLSAEKDGKDFCYLIKNTLKHKYDGLTVLFLAETHKNPFDITRSKLVYDCFSEATYANDVTLVIERGLFNGCESLKNCVYEGLSILTSLDPSRNNRIVSLLLEYLKKKKSQVIIFFYGEEHLIPIRKLLIQETDAKLKIRWIDSLSFTTTFAQLSFNEVSRFNTESLTPAGYTTSDKTKVLSNYLELLSKGWCNGQFIIPIYRKDQLKYMVSGSNPVYAIYFKNSTYHTQVKSWVDEDGAIDQKFTPVPGASIALAVKTLI